MTRKSTNTTRRSFRASFLILLGGAVVTMATTNFSSAAFQTQQAPTLRVVSEDGNRLPVVLITGDDIRNLPPGENRIIQKAGGGNATGASRPTGSVTFIIDNSQTNASFNLTKTGTGTLILPNTYRGTTTVNEGVLNSTSNTSVIKQGQGTLTLAGNNSAVANEQLTLSGIGIPVVYEFRNMGQAELDRIFMPGESTSIAARIIGLRRVTALLKPEPAKQDSAIERLMLIPAKGIRQVEGWNPGVISKATPGSKYQCRDAFCTCSGVGDCNAMIQSGKCSSAITCEEGTGGLTCGCNSR